MPMVVCGSLDFGREGGSVGVFCLNVGSKAIVSYHASRLARVSAIRIERLLSLGDGLGYSAARGGCQI